MEISPETNPENKHFGEYLKIFVEKKKNALRLAAVVILVLAAFFAGVSSADKVDLSRVGLKVLNQEPSDANLTTVDYDCFGGY